MPGWLSAAKARASLAKRSANFASATRSGASSLSATRRLRDFWRAL